MPGIAELALPVLAGALQIGASVLKKKDAADEVNQYIDLATVQNNLFDPEKHDDAYRAMYATAQEIIARKQIVPAVYWRDEATGKGAPTIAIPVSLLFDLLNAAMR